MKRSSQLQSLDDNSVAILGRHGDRGRRKCKDKKRSKGRGKKRSKGRGKKRSKGRGKKRSKDRKAVKKTIGGGGGCVGWWCRISR